MRQTPSKEKHNKKSLESQPVSLLCSGQKSSKIFANLYGNADRQTLQHQKNFIPMNKVPIIDERKLQPQIKQQQQVDLLQQLKKIRQKIEVAQKQEQQQLKIKAQKEAKAYALLQQLKRLKIKNQMLAKQAMRSDELKHEMRREKQRQQQRANDLIYQTNSSILFQERDSILVMKMLHKKQSEIMALKNRIQEISAVTAQKRLRINQLDAQIQAENKVIQEKMENIASLNHDVKIVFNQLTFSQLQVSILKMQTNPALRVGFSTVSLDPESDRKRILQKNSNSWPKNKTKSLSANEIRDYLIIQLYPSWKKMLNKMSSQFTGYRQLLCYQNQPQNSKIQDLCLYLPQKNPNARATSNKTRSIIVLYSPIPKNNQQVLKIAMDLTGLKNRVIRILSIKLQQLQENISQLNIAYEYLGSQRLKKIEVICLKTLSRQTLIKYLPSHGHDKIVLLKLQIPLILNSVTQKLQYEQVYELIRRCRC